jgi:hypothetical protein
MNDHRDGNNGYTTEPPSGQEIPFGELSRSALPPRDVWPDIQARIGAGERGTREFTEGPEQRSLGTRAELPQGGSPSFEPRRSAFGHTLLRIAATLLIFAGGAAAGWMARGGGAGTAGIPTAVDHLPGASMAEHVQSAGSHYVATLALLAEQREGLDPDELEAGHEVALATLSGAAYELTRLLPGEDEPGELYEAVETQRQALEDGVGEEQ